MILISIAMILISIEIIVGVFGDNPPPMILISVEIIVGLKRADLRPGCSLGAKAVTD
jgi:hypothetical protein